MYPFVKNDRFGGAVGEFYLSNLGIPGLTE